MVKTRNFMLHVLCAMICIVSSIDIYWLSKNRLIIKNLEQNPIGVYLLSLDDDDVSLFIALKFLGTYIAIASLYVWRYKRPKQAMAGAVALTLFQIYLCLYLYGVHIRHLPC